MLTSFHVENYKCLRDVTVPLTPIHVLIGQNDAGKTSLLEALYAFFRSSHLVLQEAFSGHWRGDDLVYERATHPQITLEGSWKSGFKYGVCVEFGKAEERACSKIEEWLTPASGKRFDLRQGKATRSEIYARRHDPAREDPNQGFEEQALGLLDGAHLYRLDARQMSLPSDLSPKRKFRLDPDGFGLPGLLDDILGFDIDKFAKIRRNFCQFFPQFKSVRIETERAVRREFRETGLHDAGETPGKGIFFETRSGKSIRAQQASDGAILFLGYLALANLPQPPKLLLIEEPETGIYPKRLVEVIALLREMIAAGGTKAPQIIFTTHSPYVLSSFQPEEVTLMSRHSPDGDVYARPLRDAPHIQERLDGFYLGELWYNLSEQELFSDA